MNDGLRVEDEDATVVDFARRHETLSELKTDLVTPIAAPSYAVRLVQDAVRMVYGVGIPTDHTEQLDGRVSTLFLQSLLSYGLRGSTVDKYYRLLRTQFFPLSPFFVNTRLFDGRAHKPAHTRIVAPQRMKRMYEYLEQIVQHHQTDEDVYDDDALVFQSDRRLAAAILISTYTGFRAITVAHMYASHLLQLVQRRTNLSIRSKNGLQNVIIMYFPQLDKLIANMSQIFHKELNILRRTGVDQFLFGYDPFRPPSTRSLLYSFKRFYTEANNGEAPPLGFGMHVSRYVLADILASNGMFDKAQQVLGHKRSSTTKRYTEPGAALALAHLLDAV